MSESASATLPVPDQNMVGEEILEEDDDCLICSRKAVTQNYLIPEDNDVDTLCAVLGLHTNTIVNGDGKSFRSILQAAKYCHSCVGRIREIESVMRRLEQLEQRLEENRRIIEEERIFIESQLESSWGCNNSISENTTNSLNRHNSNQQSRRQILAQLNSLIHPNSGHGDLNDNVNGGMYTLQDVKQSQSVELLDLVNGPSNPHDWNSGMEFIQNAVMICEPFSIESDFSFDVHEEKYEIPAEVGLTPTPVQQKTASTNPSKTSDLLISNRMKCPFEPQCEFVFQKSDRNKLITHLRRRHKVDLKIDPGFPKVVCNSLEVQLRSQCLICGIKITGQSESENQTDSTSSDISYFWKSECAKTLCKSLSLPTNPFETIFRGGDYCQTCGNYVREIDLMHKQSLSLLERLESEKDRIVNVFAENMNRIPGKNKNKVKRKPRSKKKFTTDVTDMDWSNGYNNAVRLIQLRLMSQKSGKASGQRFSTVVPTSVEFETTETDIFDNPIELHGDVLDQDEQISSNLEDVVEVNSDNREIPNEDMFSENDGPDFDFDMPEAMPSPSPNCESTESPKNRRKVMMEKYRCRYTIKCDFRKCRTKCRTEEQMKFHILKKHEGNKTPFQCTHCDRKFTMKSKLRTHARSHSNERPFICEKCGVAFKHRAALYNHVKLVHERPKQPAIPDKVNQGPRRKLKPRMFRCNFPKCRGSFEFEDNRNIHYRRRHEGDKMPFHCPHCEKRYSQCASYKAHLRVHVVGKQYFCEHCANAYKHLTSLESHIRKKHTSPPSALETNPPDPTLLCNICNKIFDTVADVETHKESHLKSETPFQCQDCQQVFTNSYDLQKHHKFNHAQMNEKGNEKRGFPCDVCDSVLSSQSGLFTHKKLRHEVRDGNAWRFSCDLCDYKYYFKSGLILHKQERHPDDTTVPPIRLFTCDFCGKGFKWKQGLMRHRPIHTGETPYVCKVCGKGFRANNDLKCHEEIHSGVRAHVCTICGKTFRAKNNLFHHMHSHTGKVRKHGQKYNRDAKFYHEAGQPSISSNVAEAVEISDKLPNTGSATEGVQMTDSVLNRL